MTNLKKGRIKTEKQKQDAANDNNVTYRLNKLIYIKYDIRRRCLESYQPRSLRLQVQVSINPNPLIGLSPRLSAVMSTT